VAQKQVVGIAVTARERAILERIPFLTLHNPIDDLRTELGRLWQKDTTIVFCLPLEKVVKLIASYVQGEHQPTVIVINSSATHVISLLGESYLVHRIAQLLDAQPIGADVMPGNPIPVDQWGMGWGWRLGAGDWQGVNQLLAAGEKVSVVQEVGLELWRRALLPSPSLLFYASAEAKGLVYISHRHRPPQPYQVQWHPRVLWVGLTCDPDTPAALIRQAIQTACQIHYLTDLAIAGVASPTPNDRLAQLAQDHDWLYHTFPTIPTPAALVLQLGGQDAQLIVAEQVFHHTNQQGTVTIAIALSPQEYIGKPGYIGILPSQVANPTRQERQCLLTADVIMAKHLPPEFAVGKIVESDINYPQAVALAQMGLNVALINDRADLVFSYLLEQGWDGSHSQVEVIPGVSQIQQVGAKLGLNLQENFSVINLHGGEAGEGILQRRIEAAAISDLILVILEPCTPLRLTPLIISLEILRHYRSVTTPVAIVNQAHITITQLNNIDIKLIDRDTIIFIGNEYTQLRGVP